MYPDALPKCVCLLFQEPVDGESPKRTVDLFQVPLRRVVFYHRCTSSVHGLFGAIQAFCDLAYLNSSNTALERIPTCYKDGNYS